MILVRSGEPLDNLIIFSFFAIISSFPVMTIAVFKVLAAFFAIFTESNSLSLSVPFIVVLKSINVNISEALPFITVTLTSPRKR